MNDVDEINGDIYIYKLTTDNGGAPCVKDNLLSLCICKPRIRQSAKVGDWIIGMGGRSVPELNGRLIYIAKVTNKLTGDKYYNGSYSDRPDCIYSFNGNIYSWIAGSSYHEAADLTHDLGEGTSYDRAICLLSKEFAYFGGDKVPSIGEIRDIYDGLPRDFRKNHDDDTYLRLNNYIMSIQDEFGFGVHGKPTHSNLTSKCNQSEGDVMVSKGCG